MGKKQTAVDYLVTIVQSCIAPNFIPGEIIKQAKQMEKEQMIEFADKYGFDVCHFDYDRAEQYYKQTYNKEDNG